LFFGCNNEPTKNDNVEANIAVVQPKYRIKVKDERTKKPELEQFVNYLEKVIQNKDAQELLKICDDSIVISEGSGVFGKDNFVKEFKLYNKNSAFWSMAEKYIKLGGEFSKENGETVTYSIPTCFGCQNKKIDEEPDNHIFNVIHIVKDSAILYEKPDEKSKLIARFRMGTILWDNEKSIGNEQDGYLPKWCFVQTFDKNLSGFMKSDCLYGESEFSFTIQKKNGQYKIVSFAPFD
jgi:hypothetical protein